MVHDTSLLNPKTIHCLVKHRVHLQSSGQRYSLILCPQRPLLRWMGGVLADEAKKPKPGPVMFPPISPF